MKARLLAGVAGALVAATAFIGFAHTKAGRPILGWMGRSFGGASSCPLGYDRAATPAQREAERSRFGASHRGVGEAMSRPALGFALDRTTRGDVRAWADAHGLSCTSGKGMADLRCPDVPDEIVPGPFRGAGKQAIWFVFGAQGQLITVTAIAHSDRPEAISSAFASATGELDRAAGPKTKLDGDSSPSSLASGALYQASAEYRFADYYAVERATNVGAGYALTAEYRSL